MYNQMQKKLQAFRRSTWFDRIVIICYLIAFSALALMLFRKCRYGFAYMDEAFHVAVPYRFIQGDKPLLNEWHLSQFSFLTVVPVMWVYMQIVGSTNGIFLSFRYIFTACWCLASLFIYLRTKKLHRFGAVFAALMFQSYVPYALMDFSYNSLGLLYLVNAAIFLLCAKRRQKAQFTISGIFYAGAVLCCPYLAVIFFLYSAVFGISLLRNKRTVFSLTLEDAGVRWKFFTLGVSILAAIILFVLLDGASPRQLLQSLSYAMKDPDHQDFSFVNKGLRYLLSFSNSNDYFFPMLFTILLIGVFSVIMNRLRYSGRSFHKPSAVFFDGGRACCHALVCGAVILYLRRFLQESVYINYLALPLTFAGLYVAIISQNDRIRRISVGWFLPGVLYTFCLHYSSNQHFYVISTAAAVSSLASIYMLWLYCDEMEKDEQQKGSHYYIIAYLAVLLCCVFQLRYQIPVRYQSVYWEPGLMKYEEQQEVKGGPEDGLIARADMAEYYQGIYNDLKDLHHHKVLYLTLENWMQLISDNEFSSYSPWPSGISETTLRRLNAYYDMCPNKKPEIIFLDREFEELLVYFPPEQFQIDKSSSGNYFIYPREMTGEFEQPFFSIVQTRE